MRRLRLHPRHAKPLWHGHPWVFAKSVATLDDPEPSDLTPDWVEVADETGRVVGRGLLSEASAIRARLLSWGGGTQSLDALLQERIGDAVALRERLFDDPEQTNAYRLVHSEGDRLPGLVVDRYGDVLVAQFATGPMAARREMLASWLLDATGATSLCARAGGFEETEGIGEEVVAFRAGAEVPETLQVREAGLTMQVAPLHGQKTGHYADQRENRCHVAEIASGLTMLDLYAGTGGFSLQALAHGADAAIAVDSSPRSAAMAQVNAQANGLDDRMEIHTADVRDTLGELSSSKRRFGVVVVDPPSFFPRRGPASAALKAYRELNVRALSRVTASGGFVATFSCSSRMEPAAFLELVQSASRDCRRTFRVLRVLHAGPDHPVAADGRVGRYLTGLLLRVDPEES